jgi:hypothetical protein
MNCQEQRDYLRENMHDTAGSLMIAPAWVTATCDRRDISGTSQACFGDIHRKAMILACVREIRIRRARRVECMSDTTLPTALMHLTSLFL